ncbi:MAG: hypothetical protein H7A21_14025 [Spirochaetales bacterium]|nr:hypothetical protein [Leptospiraceae bacterium]MCP5482550.1 hypothetical protein [Spirochaetales bacterium]MCP5485140.1 hypothetical protein [Spirochaetales bacterium]
MNIESLVTLLSVAAVLITFLFGFMERRSSDRRQRTLEFLLKVIEGEGPIHEAHVKFAGWARQARVFENDELLEEEDNIVIKLLDYYDLVADTAFRGVIDKNMIVLHLGGRMKSTFDLLENYVHHRRIRLRRKGLYLPLETFVRKHVQGRSV